MARIPVLSVGNASKARRAARRRTPTDSLRLALAGGATMTTMTTTTYLFLVVAAEGPTICLLELAQVGQASPRGTFKIPSPPASIPRINPMPTWDLSGHCFRLPMYIWVTIYHLHLYDAWMFYALTSWKRLHVSFALFVWTIIACRLFITITPNPGVPSPTVQAHCRGGGTAIADPYRAYRYHHAGDLVAALHLEPWSHHYIPQNPVSFSMPEKF